MYPKSLKSISILAGIYFAASLPATAGAQCSIYLTQWGSPGSGNGQFNSPRGVGTDSAGNVYVVDTFNQRIQKFTGAGTYLTQWGTSGSGNGQLSNPRGIASDAGGDVYVAEQNNHRIQKFTGTGDYLTKWGSFGSDNGQFSNPVGVATDGFGDVYVADQNNNRIQKFTGTGTYLTQWGSFGSGNGQFRIPSGVATDAAGNVYVADTNNQRIQKFTNTGAYLTQWGSLGSGNGQFNSPRAVATDASGAVYVVDYVNQRIQKFTSTGTYLCQWGSFGSGNGQLDAPYGVATDPAGNAYVADSNNNRIQKFGVQATIAPGPSLNEGNGGLTAFNFTVNLSGPALEPVIVYYETSDGSATVAANDYQPASGSIAIPATATSGSITVNVVGDAEFESDETFNVTITSVTGGATLGSPAGATGVILNEDQTFTDIEAGLPGVIYGSEAWGDYDSDGDLDILLTGSTNSDALISNVYRNDGGTFTDLALGLPGVVSGSVAWADYDNDGDLDFVLTGAAIGLGRISRVYRNDAGTFNDIAAGLPGVNIGSVAWGDYDNDGDLDLLLAGRTDSGYISRVYSNNSETFTDIVAGLPGVVLGSVAWGDFDNDGDLDLVLTGDTGTEKIARVYRNDAGTFSDHTAGLPGVWTSSAAWGDFDNDGDLDLVLAGIKNDSEFTSRVYRNDSGTFADHVAGLQGISDGSVAWGDYDNDGDLDLALMGFTGTGFSRVYRNDLGIFVGLALGLQGAYSGSVAWGDYDNDGDLDLLLSGKPGSGEHISRVYRNDGAPMNSPPTVPGNLSSNVADNHLTLSWDASTDTQTPAAGLSYNLRVGTTPGGNQITAAMTENANGYRRVVQLGNAQKRTSWTLSLLNGGNYYWSVQAIDAGFAGSPFAAELGPVSGVNDGSPSINGFALKFNTPNPFQSSTQIAFELPTTGHVQLRVFDVSGRLVAMLKDGEMSPGSQMITWDGTNGGGQAMPPGRYFYHLKVGAFEKTRGMTLLR